MEEKTFTIETDEVEFDEELFKANLEENDFSAWDDEVGKGDDE